MLRVVCWKWEPTPGYRSKFDGQSVNVLRNMVARHYTNEHEFVCITDNPKGIDKDIRIIPLWDDHSKVLNPHGHLNPSCYRRLKAFSIEAKDFIGPRFVSLDLDTVIVDDMRPLWDIPEDFAIWGDTTRNTPYNGSMWLMTAGARRQVWDQFDPKHSPQIGLRNKYIGSDQAWIAVCLGPNERRWTASEGVYSYRNEVSKRGSLPKDARIVMFHGDQDPWGPGPSKLEWVKEHYR